jgi:hypothetical protein
MVDRAPLETVEDVKKAIFELSNAAGKLGRDFKAWEDIAFTPEGPPDFIVIREGLRALNYTTTMLLEDVLQWCAANMPPQEPRALPHVELWVEERGRLRPLRMPQGQTVTATCNGVDVGVREVE